MEFMYFGVHTTARDASLILMFGSPPGYLIDPRSMSWELAVTKSGAKRAEVWFIERPVNDSGCNT